MRAVSAVLNLYTWSVIAILSVAGAVTGLHPYQVVDSVSDSLGLSESAGVADILLHLLSS